FVLAINTTTNTVYVGQGKDHQGLFRKALFVKTDEIHWIREDLRMNIGEQREYMVRIRYRQPLEKATLYMKKEGLYIVFESLQRGIAPGQFAAWYAADELIGSGVIS
ncbi:MAG TPA: tRNA 2-thiouridine(34) synthase MnmA, partial [Bacteroidales bacterium]|nr:tRNA 2-thiouridine(34) synthase MnmA [Bacteroidales bacterium]